MTQPERTDQQHCNIARLTLRLSIVGVATVGLNFLQARASAELKHVTHQSPLSTKCEVPYPYYSKVPADTVCVASYRGAPYSFYIVEVVFVFLLFIHGDFFSSIFFSSSRE